MTRAGKPPRRVAALGLLLIWLAAPARADYTPGEHIDESLVHDTVTRYYDVHVPPSYTGVAAVPLVVDIHGFSSNKTDQRSLSGFSALSDAAGFIVAYPQGLHGDPADDEAPYPPAVPLQQVEGPSWNAGDYCCGQALVEGTDDVGFLRTMVADIAATGNIDPQRIYVTGLSNGGFLTQRLACEAADLFAAAASVASPGAFDPLTDCNPSRPIPVIAFQGYTDQLVPYAGGYLLGDPTLPSVPSAQATLGFWRDENGCAGSTPDEVFDTGPSSQCEQYNQCQEGVLVELCSVTGLAQSPLLGHILYFNEDGLDVAARAWSFMSAHTLPAAAVPALAPGAVGALAALLGTIGASSARRRARRAARRTQEPGFSGSSGATAVPGNTPARASSSGFAVTF